MELTGRVRQKYDLSTVWTSKNTVLLAGEIGIESDTLKMKVGDGTTAWNSLTYIGDSSSANTYLNTDLSNIDLLGEESTRLRRVSQQGDDAELALEAYSGGNYANRYNDTYTGDYDARIKLSNGTIELVAADNTSNNTASGRLQIQNGSLLFNNTLVSLQGHTHSYLPLSGGTMAGNIEFHAYEDATEGEGYSAIISRGSSIKGTPPADEEWYTMLMAADSSGGTTNTEKYGQVETRVGPDGTTETRLQAYKNEAGSASNASLTVGYDTNGNPYATAPATRTVGVSSLDIITFGTFTSYLSNYLSKSGGTMTGAITRSGDFVQNTGDSNWLRLNGATEYSKGAFIQLYGKDHTSNAGEFRLTASNGSSAANLIGYPDGRMTWSGGLIFANNSIRRSGTSNWLRFTGGETDYTDGASLIVYGKDHSTNPGVFSLSAYAGTNRYNLTGSASGRLSWTGDVHLIGDGVHGGDLTGQTADLNTCYSSISGAVKLFHCNTDSGSNDISNCPENKAFLLVSFTPRRLSASDYVVHQHFYCIGAHYSRRCTNGTWTDWLLEVGASSASVGDANIPIYLNNGVITSTGKSFANYLPLTGGNLTGTVTNSGIYYKTIANIDLSTTSTSSRENHAFQINRNPVDTTNSSGNIAQIHVSQISNSQNMEVGIRVSNPRGGNLPATGTNVRTSNCWDKIGLRYNYALNQAYAFTSNPPVLDTTDNRYYANHLATVGNVNSAIANYLPLSGGNLTGGSITYTPENTQKLFNLFLTDTNSTNVDVGWDYTNCSGALLGLRSADHSSMPGWFELYARTTDASYELSGKPDGTLNWSGSVFDTSILKFDSNKLYRTNNTNNSWIRITGGGSDNDGGASLLLYGKGNSGVNAGRFVLRGYDGTNAFTLDCQPANSQITCNACLVLSKTTDLSGTADNGPALVIGGARTGAHIEIDANEIQAKSSGTAVTTLYIHGDGGTVTFGTEAGGASSNSSSKQFTPRTTKTITLGASSYLWKQLFANTTTISTSDARAKQQIAEIPDELLDAWSSVSWKRYKMNDSVEEKGSEAARYHTGVIAQEVDSVFKEADLDVTEYGFFCYDQWNAKPAVMKGDKVVESALEAGDAYAVRYEEALCIEAAYLRREISRLKSRIEQLERSNI